MEAYKAGWGINVNNPPRIDFNPIIPRGKFDQPLTDLAGPFSTSPLQPGEPRDPWDRKADRPPWLTEFAAGNEVFEWQDMFKTARTLLGPKDHVYFMSLFGYTMGEYMCCLFNMEGLLLQKALLDFRALQSGAVLALGDLAAVGELWLFPVTMGMYEGGAYSWRDVTQPTPDGILRNIFAHLYPKCRFWAKTIAPAQQRPSTSLAVRALPMLSTATRTRVTVPRI
jgi:hypothetical protein